MEKKQRTWVTLILTILLVCTMLTPAYATPIADEIMPRLNTNINATSIRNLSSTGVLSVTNTYSVNDSQVTKVVVTTYVEKRNLLLFWDQVDIGTTNNEWVDYGSNGYFSKSHSAQMPSSGTYRITTIFDVYNGSALLDSIEKISKLNY